MAKNLKLSFVLLFIALSIQVIIADNYYSFFYINGDDSDLKDVVALRNENEALIPIIGIYKFIIITHNFL